MAKIIRLVKRGFDAVNVEYDGDNRAYIKVGPDAHYSLSVALTNALVYDLKSKGFN